MRAVCILLLSAWPAISLAQDHAPISRARDTLPLERIPVIELAPLDMRQVYAEDQRRQQEGLPPRFAIPHHILADPSDQGIWEELENDVLLWRVRVRAPGALSLNLGFTGFQLPANGQLLVYATNGGEVIRPFTAADNEDHRQLWTPVVLADDIIVELSLPRSELEQLVFHLTQIGHGYRGFGEQPVERAARSGACNVDTICQEGNAWRDEIASVGVISLSGTTFCTGFMVNNTANDRTPYFMTAHHCGINNANAASLVVYWNYDNSLCREPGSQQSGSRGDGRLTQFNTGAIWRAARARPDFTLVELDDTPDPSFGVTFAGWDRSDDDSLQGIAIHHPNTDEKRISFEYDPTSTTSYLQNTSPGNGSHIRVEDWDLGTTEPGSSGSPLFNQDQRVVGQLHGGYAACGNNASDWYGRFSVSWDGASPSSRLRDWLDPVGSGALTVDTIGDPYEQINPDGNGLDPDGTMP